MYKRFINLVALCFLLLLLCACTEGREEYGWCTRCGEAYYSNYEQTTVQLGIERFCTSCAEEMFDISELFTCYECGEARPLSLRVHRPDFSSVCTFCAYELDIDLFAYDDDEPFATCINCGSVTSIEFELSGGVGGSYAYVCFDCYESLPHCEECGCATPKDLLLTIDNNTPICIYCAQACGFSIIVTE